MKKKKTCSWRGSFFVKRFWGCYYYRFSFGHTKAVRSVFVLASKKPISTSGYDGYCIFVVLLAQIRGCFLVAGGMN